MARQLIPSDATIRAIRPGDPRKRLSDGDGLVLLLFVRGDRLMHRAEVVRIGGKSCRAKEAQEREAQRLAARSAKATPARSRKTAA